MTIHRNLYVFLYFLGLGEESDANNTKRMIILGVHCMGLLPVPAYTFKLQSA